jgi:hypothetical protein
MALTVKIEIECSPRAAATLLPILYQARKLSKTNASRWCCFYADGAEDFKLDKISVEADKEIAGVIEESADIWVGNALFDYTLDNYNYQHKAGETYFSDAG